MQLNGKTAIITGGGSGIGAAIAKHFAEAGAQVVICGRRQENLDQTATAIHGTKPVRTFAADIGNLTQVQSMVSWAEREFGQVDILVNNAGLNVRQRRVFELQPDSWQKVIDANMTGVFNLIYALLPPMRQRRDGLIITVSSMAALRPSSLGGAVYSASKHGVNALMKVLADEEGGNGIRASIINPGEVNTPLLDDRPVQVSDEHRARILHPDDIAAAALFIATQPANVHIAEITIKPVTQAW